MKTDTPLVTGPSSGVGEAPLAITGLQRIVALQRTAFLRDGSPSLAQRRADLNALRSALVARRHAIEDALNVDCGHHSRHETAIMEVVGVLEGIKYLRRNLRAFMRPTRRHVALHMRFGNARVEYQPLGVVGVMSPWNYPVILSLMPVVTAIAAGNRVMLKPSEFTPATNAVLATMLDEIFREEQVALVNGDASVGAAFSALPFDHLVFTGSTPVGRAVMKAASENLVPVTLELGGKSPVIVASQGHIRPGPLEQHRLPACPLRGPCRHSSQVLSSVGRLVYSSADWDGQHGNPGLQPSRADVVSA